MTSWSRYGWMRRSGSFASVVLMLAGLLSITLPVMAAPNSTNNNTITVSKLNQQERYAEGVTAKAVSRWIEIDLSEQRLNAWEGKQLIYSFRVSTGKKSTPTPTGKFLIGSKYRYNRMRGSDYDIPDVPYAMYFYKGYAIHGAYWHNNFGTPVSHGCVNLRVSQARNLYNWARLGTLVVVHK